MAYRTRQMFIGQRTQTINALRSHLAEHGVIAATNKCGLKRLSAMIENETVALPDNVRGMARVDVDHIGGLTVQIAEMT